MPAGGNVANISPADAGRVTTSKKLAPAGVAVSVPPLPASCATRAAGGGEEYNLVLITPEPSFVSRATQVDLCDLGVPLPRYLRCKRKRGRGRRGRRLSKKRKEELEVQQALKHAPHLRQTTIEEHFRYSADAKANWRAGMHPAALRKKFAAFREKHPELDLDSEDPYLNPPDDPSEYEPDDEDDDSLDQDPAKR